MTRRAWLVVIPILAFVAYLISEMPRGFSTDLTRVGSAPVTLVAVHDLNLVASTNMMSLLHSIEDAYDDRVLMLVADVNNREGRAFAERHGARPATVLLFDDHAEQIDTIAGSIDAAAVRAAIDAALAQP